MLILRIRSAIALIATLSLLSGCGNKPSSQTSTPKVEGDRPIQSVPSDDEQILNGTRDIVARQLGLETSAIHVDVPLSKQKVAADELDVVEIIMNVEETFGIEIKDEEIINPDGNLRDDLSVRHLVNMVVTKQGRK